ncbi:hypothetical protein NQ314_009705 [Rhamnusium bicolor]|uniref:YqaJ viral recombinase domain-containing protein n=1 Tax=Rhamnusium bicolor TaxID=1586634 RepID=A0AAV8XX03_9CUCU|nr:hypothetical protein NQ314_009705 [Rhamnusium bicolor]
MNKSVHFIAASPDSIIDEDNAVVEIKCPYSARNMTPDEGILSRKISFLEKNGSVNENHSWLYQIQGQLHITGLAMCYFAMWTEKGVKVEKINKNDEFWENCMQTK